MKLACTRSGVIAFVVLLLQSCGGGDGDGDGDNGGNRPVPRLSVNLTQIDVSAAPGEEAPRSQIIVTITNPRPNEDLYVGAGYTTFGIDRLDFFGTSSSSGHLEIFFRPATQLETGTYEDRIELHVCTDEACTEDIANSPITINTTYDVMTGTAARIDRDYIELRTDTQDVEYRRETVRLEIDRAPLGGAFIRTRDEGNGLSFVEQVGLSPTETDLEIEFISGASLRPGVYDGTVTINVCYDNTCSREMDGSPFTVVTRMTVDTAPEPGVDVLEVASRVTLAHDVVDAEYSAALDAVVMAATYPANALYLYDVDSAIEQSVPLSLPPTAVTVAPDGLSAAVGHVGAISVVDLDQLGQPGAPAPVVLDTTADVFDLVLDGRATVHALPRPQTWVDVHSIDLATNTEQLSGGQLLYGGVLGRLHPSGDFLYTVGRADSFYDLQKWDLTSGTATWVAHGSQGHQEYLCGNLWYRTNGAALYTACGNVFRSSDNPATDMTKIGKLELYAPRDFDWLIQSLSHDPSSGQLALLEAETEGCVQIVPEAARCYTHLVTYDDDTLERLSLFTLGPVTVGERSYPQRGLFLFHDSTGDRMVLLSKLDGMTEPDTEFYLSLVE